MRSNWLANHLDASEEEASLMKRATIAKLQQKQWRNLLHLESLFPQAPGVSRRNATQSAEDEFFLSAQGEVTHRLLSCRVGFVVLSLRAKAKQHGRIAPGALAL